MMRPLSSVGLLVVALCTSAGQGYLPVVGPPALRFAPPPPPPPAVLIPLPPLSGEAGEPGGKGAGEIPFFPPGSLSPQLPFSPAADSTNAAVDPVFIDPFVVPPATVPVPGPPANTTPAVQPETLVPQMFMKYFIGGAGTNGTGVSIFSPVDFVPPLPIVPPSSSATFQTVPPAKP